jgi:putative glutamine amidotransferase
MFMSAPLIGITTSHLSEEGKSPTSTIPDVYISAVTAAGGVPLLLPVGLSVAHLPTLRGALDGILLSGGADIDPDIFGGIPHPKVYGVDAGRDALEIELVHLAVGTRWPLLAICRGEQVMNVALGGTLYTHIADQHPGAIRHDCGEYNQRDETAHTVTVQADSRLAQIIGELADVNSFHHQGIDRLGSGLRAAAFAPDGLIEAIELPEHPYALGVQWHPECMPADVKMQALFQSFVSACRRQRA